jgi:ElaB/YqjD/DUF883 family membrane-anchored ribosome-binding protein
MENQLNAGTEAFQSDKEKLSKDVGSMVNEASSFLKSFGGEKLETAKASLSQASTMVSDNARQYADVTDEYVRANPWKALGVAAAAGVLVGILLSRR